MGRVALISKEAAGRDEVPLLALHAAAGTDVEVVSRHRLPVRVARHVNVSADHAAGLRQRRKRLAVAGAVAGGVVGDQVGKRSGGSETAWQVSVRLDNGQYVTVTQRNDPGVRRGDYVEVSGNQVYAR